MEIAFDAQCYRLFFGNFFFIYADFWKVRHLSQPPSSWKGRSRLCILPSMRRTKLWGPEKTVQVFVPTRKDPMMTMALTI